MKKLFLILITIVFIACNEQENAKLESLHFSKNILNFRVSPKNAFDKNGLMFSDQGAWFAYSFPDSIPNYGGFSGPFLLTQQNGVWCSSALTQLVLKNIKWNTLETNSYSSHLEQVLCSSELKLTQQLVFLSGHTALIKSTIENISSKKVTFNYSLKNENLLAEGLSFTSSKNELTINSSKSKAVGHIIFPESTVVSISKNVYSTNLNKVVLKANESKEIIISQSFIFPEYSWEQEKKLISNSNFDIVLAKIKSEKNSELNSLISKRKKVFLDDKYSEVLVKAHLTLQNNWRIPAGEIKYQGLFPSYHYKWFNGFWAWDSWKHAVGLSYYNTDLAKSQIKLMFEFQTEDGFIVDCVFRDTLIEKPNFRDTKPPLSAWAVGKIYNKDRDHNFVKELYPKLQKYHQWWYLKRDHDKDSLCEYGSTDGSLVAAKWESGMDNAIRFDDAEILKNDKDAYSMNQESVDLNSYLYAEKLFLMKLAKALNKTEEAETYKLEAEILKQKIQHQFFDVIDGWFYDTNLEGTRFIKGEGSEGWTPLWANAATYKQAEMVKNNMMNPKKFFTKVPFQTMSADHPKFNPLKGYWRGPNWLDQAYFGVKGFMNYSFNEETATATIQILEGANGVLGKGTSIRENYHPLTGEGLNAKNFSWSAAHIIMLLTDE